MLWIILYFVIGFILAVVWGLTNGYGNDDPLIVPIFFFWPFMLAVGALYGSIYLIGELWDRWKYRND